MFHLLWCGSEEAGEEDEAVGVGQRFEAGNVGGAGFDFPVFVESEQDGAIESVVFCEDSSERGDGFLGSVFMVAGDEDEFFAYRVRCFVDHRVCIGVGVQSEQGCESAGDCGWQPEGAFSPEGGGIGHRKGFLRYEGVDRGGRRIVRLRFRVCRVS